MGETVETGTRPGGWARMEDESMFERKENEMEKEVFALKVVFTTPVLGSQPSKDVASQYLAKKLEERVRKEGGFEPLYLDDDDLDVGEMPKAAGGNGNGYKGGLPEDELASLPEMQERGTTTFHRDERGRPCFFNYQVNGFIREAAKQFNGKLDGNGKLSGSGVKNLRSKVTSFVFVRPRQIALIAPPNTGIEYLERPLRAETMQGPRVTLVRSEMLPAETYFYCEVVILKGGQVTGELVRSLMEYGEWKGLGQWRNGDYGSFHFEWDKVEE